MASGSPSSRMEIWGTRRALAWADGRHQHESLRRVVLGQVRALLDLYEALGRPAGERSHQLISLACQPRSSCEAVPAAPLAKARRTAYCHPPGETESRPRASAHPPPAINRTATTSRRDREHGRA